MLFDTIFAVKTGDFPVNCIYTEKIVFETAKIAKKCGLRDYFFCMDTITVK